MTVKPGQTLGQYVVLEQIGKGGMATVFRASQPSLSRQVAIKVLPDFFAQDPAFHERFRQEAMAIAKLRHPNILTVFDSGEADGVAYIVAELLDGGTLAAKLGKPLPIDEVVAIARPIASALDFAHTRGMIHRDVKPTNILLTADGTPILADFGLARMTGNGGNANDAITRLTVTGTALGTPEYMAPEQIRGTNVGPAADIYALAAMLYEMLTGSVPHTGDTPIALLMSRLNDPLPLPRERNPNLPVAVQDVLVKGLATDPAARYRTAGEMIVALEAAGRPAASTLAALPSPQRQRSRALVGGLAALALLVVAGVMWSQSGAVPQPPAGPKTPVPAAQNGTGTTLTATPVSTPVTTSTPAPPTARPVAPAPTEATAPKRANGGALPVHGQLLYSLVKDAPTVAAARQPRADDTITAKDGSIIFTAGSEAGVFVPLPVQNIGDFVAVLRYVAIDRRPSLTFRFHVDAHGEGQAVRLPTYARLSASDVTARAQGSHTCCQPFDVFLAPQRPDSRSIFPGQEPVASPAAANEEQRITVAATGSTIVVTSGESEIARVSDSSFGPGGITLGISGTRSELPAVLKVNMLDIYEAPANNHAAAGPIVSAKSDPPVRGRLLYDMATDLSSLSSARQQHPEDTVVVTGKSLELTAGTITGVNLPLPVGGVGDFVAVMRFVSLGREPQVYLRFHQAAPQTGAHVIQIPAFLRLIAPAPGAQAVGPHACCGNFDIYVAPAAGAQSLLTGPVVGSVPSAANEEHEIVVSVKGALMVVYADGHEIARAADASLAPGRMFFQVVARRQNTPAVLRLNALQIYEVK